MRISITIHHGPRALAINPSMAQVISGEPNLCSTCSSLRMGFYSRHVVHCSWKAAAV